jgi:hypothetical protein
MMLLEHALCSVANAYNLLLLLLLLSMAPLRQRLFLHSPYLQVRPRLC